MCVLLRGFYYAVALVLHILDVLMSRGYREYGIVNLHREFVTSGESEIALPRHHLVSAIERDGQHGELQTVGYHEGPAFELSQFAGV